MCASSCSCGSTAGSAFSSSPSGVVSGVGPGWAGCVACGDVSACVCAGCGLCCACAGLPLCAACAPSLPPSPSVASVVWAGFRSGGLVAWAVRPSARASSGWVCALSFGSVAAAGRAARRAAGRAGVSVAVRRSGALWSVSVPVAPVGWLSGALFFGGVGGVRGVAAALRSWSALAVA